MDEPKKRQQYQTIRMREEDFAEFDKLAKALHYTKVELFGQMVQEYKANHPPTTNANPGKHKASRD